MRLLRLGLLEGWDTLSERLLSHCALRLMRLHNNIRAIPIRKLVNIRWLKRDILHTRFIYRYYLTNNASAALALFRRWRSKGQLFRRGQAFVWEIVLFLCSVPITTMVAVDEHLQHPPRDTRLCRFMVMAIAQLKGHVWEAQSVAVCQIIVAWPTPRPPFPILAAA